MREIDLNRYIILFFWFYLDVIRIVARRIVGLGSGLDRRPARGLGSMLRSSGRFLPRLLGCRAPSAWSRLCAILLVLAIDDLLLFLATLLLADAASFGVHVEPVGDSFAFYPRTLRRLHWRDGKRGDVPVLRACAQVCFVSGACIGKVARISVRDRFLGG